MSVILKALRAQKENVQGSGSVNTGKEGLFLGKGGFVQSPPKKINKRTLILALLLVVVGSATLLLRQRIQKIGLPSPAVSIEALAVKTPTAPTGETPALSQIMEEAKKSYEQGNWDVSLSLWQKGLEQSPNNASIHNNLGLIFLKKEIYSSAEKHFSRSLELDQSCAECFNNLGYLKSLLGEAKEAETYLKKSVQLNPQYADPHFNLAVLYEKNDNLGGAAQSFQNFLVLQKDPNSKISFKVQQHLRELTGK